MNKTSLKIRCRGICSRIANLTRHLVSSESLRTAGKIVFWNDSNPMTLCRVLMVLMTLRRTSAHSSLRKPTKRGNKCSFVFSGPIIDANFIIVEARAVFTGWCGSSNALREYFKNGTYRWRGLLWVELYVSSWGSFYFLLGVHLQNCKYSSRLELSLHLQDLSPAFWKYWLFHLLKELRQRSMKIEVPKDVSKAETRSTSMFASAFRTLQLLSSWNFFNMTIILLSWVSTSSLGMIWTKAGQIKSLTESWSSATKF